MVQDQIAFREKEIQQLPVRNLEEMAVFNEQRGIKNGLILALAIPASMLEELQQKWQDILEEDRNGS